MSLDSPTLSRFQIRLCVAPATSHRESVCTEGSEYLGKSGAGPDLGTPTRGHLPNKPSCTIEGEWQVRQLNLFR